MIIGRRTVLMLPFGAAAVGGLGFFAILEAMRRGSFDPRGVPSMITGKHVPPFELPGLGDSAGFSSTDLAAGGGPVLVNFWASWCPPCLEEHPLLLELQRQGVVIWGIAYKDTPDQASGFLARHGNPFARVARDDPGRTAIDWGLTGVPESFVVDGHGMVRWHEPGPLTQNIIDRQLQPVLRRVTS